jgi:glycosyltransferase involved in cell wall biosynthesis
VGGHKGASLHVAELVRSLCSAGADVRVLAARVADSPAMGLEAEVIDVGGSRAARRTRESLLKSVDGQRDPAGVAEAAAIVFNQDMARALEKLHRDRPIDAIYERYSLWSYAASGFAATHRIPYVVEVNAPLPEEQRRYRSLRNEQLADTLERHLFSRADRLLVPSSALVPYAVSRGADAKIVKVIPNAADPARFRPRGARSGKETFTIGFVGSLKPWHGLGDLARAFRRLHRSWKGYRLLVVGDGPLRSEIESMVSAWGLADAVTFTGAAGHEQIPGLLGRMDAALAPYPADAPTYFSPIKIFEYMASGTPIVASRIGQVGDVLAHRRTALLHRPGGIAEMVACIDELRRRPALGAKLATAARKALVGTYTWKKNAARVVREIESVRRDLARIANGRVASQAPSKRRRSR